MRDGQFGPERIGDVLDGQTLFWTGPAFGFGFYKAGHMRVSFIFDVKNKGINDSLKMPNVKGQMIDATCVFTKDLAWVYIAYQSGGETLHQCTLVKQTGEIVATEEARSADNRWISSVRFGCAAGNFLFVPTDEGIIRIEPNTGKLIEGKIFPDTEPFVNSNDHLHVLSDGIYVVSNKEITKIKIA